MVIVILLDLLDERELVKLDDEVEEPVPDSVCVPEADMLRDRV